MDTDLLQRIENTDVHIKYDAQTSIHHITFYKPSRAALDAAFAYFTALVGHYGEEDTACFLIDMSQIDQMPPISYAFRKTRGLIQQYQALYRSRRAVLYRRGMVISLVKALLSTLPPFFEGRDSVAFFQIEQREDALAWLSLQDS